QVRLAISIDARYRRAKSSSHCFHAWNQEPSPRHSVPYVALKHRAPAMNRPVGCREEKSLLAQSQVDQFEQLLPTDPHGRKSTSEANESWWLQPPEVACGAPAVQSLSAGLYNPAPSR